MATTVAAGRPPEFGMESIEKLPPFPPAASKLLTLLGDENVNLRDVQRLVSAEAAFSGEILRVANSASMELRFEVTSVLHAVSVLGMERLRAIVLTLALRRVFAGRDPLMVRVWRHNFAAALIAEATASSCWLDRAKSYTCGLLHKAGRTALVAINPGLYAKVLQDAGSAEDPALTRQELAVFGISGADVGVRLSEHWRLPGQLRRLLDTGGKPRDESEALQRRIVALSCEGAARAGFGLIDEHAEWEEGWLPSQVPEADQQRLRHEEACLKAMLLVRINQLECELQGF